MLQRAHNATFWDMTPLDMVEIYISFGRTSSYFQRGRGLVGIHRYIGRKSCLHLLSTGFSKPEYGGSIFPQNFGIFLLHFTM